MFRRAKDPTRLLPWLCDNSPFLANLSQDTTRLLFRGAELQRFPAGAVISRQAEPFAHTYVVTEGCAAVRVESRGVKREVLSVQPSEFVGLGAMFDHGAAPYDIVAVGATEVVAIDTRQIARLRAAFHPRVIALQRAFWPLLCQHLQMLDRRCGEIAVRKQGLGGTPGAGASR